MAVQSKKQADKTQAIACDTLERIEKEGLPPTPEIYTLWFNYYDSNPEIVGAIDRIKGGVDEATCHKLYKRYLSSAHHDDSVQNIGSQMQQAMGEMATMLSSVQAAATGYTGKLDNVTDKMQSVESIEDLEAVVSAIAEDTKAMVEYNQSLEAELSNSSSQVQELQKDLDVVRKEAMTDGLTGLANRKAFDQYLENSIEYAQENGTSLTLLIMDIDHFKNFNDTYGHQIGDQVLRLVARALVDGIKGRDIAARYGGEEFVIILPETPTIGGEMVGNALRKAIEQKEVINRTTNEKLGQITISIGVAEYNGSENSEELIERADVAMYKAKDTGRNRVVIAEG